MQRAAVAQRNRQRREQRFARRMVVVVGRPADQLEDVGLQDGLLIDDFAKRLQIGCVVFGPGSLDDEAYQFTGAERHADARARMRT